MATVLHSCSASLLDPWVFYFILGPMICSHVEPLLCYEGFAFPRHFGGWSLMGGVGGEGQVGVLFLPSRLSLSFRMGLQTLPPVCFCPACKLRWCFKGL